MRDRRRRAGAFEISASEATIEGCAQFGMILAPT
jgi:hypothetical protein